MSRQLKQLIKKQRKLYRKQVFSAFYREKLKEEKEFNGIMMGAALSTNIGPLLMAVGSTDIMEHMAKMEAVEYACDEMVRRGLW